MPELEYLIVPHLSIKQITRLFEKIRVNPVTGCWEWTGAPSTKGYGVTTLNGKWELAHRVMYAWATGEPVPKGRAKDTPVLDHLVCDNRICCCPWHVAFETRGGNVLRGTGITAQNLLKTKCPKGHAYVAAPETWASTRARQCYECRRESAREYQRRKHGFKPRVPKLPPAS